MKRIIFFLSLFFMSCSSIRYNDGLGYFTDEMYCYLISEDYYGGINSQIIRVRHLYDEFNNDTLFISFNCAQNNYPKLDTLTIYTYSFSTFFNNSIGIFNKHNIFNYNKNLITNIKNVKLEGGIEYIIQIEDTIRVSYFFKFEEMDNNLRKMDFELLPNMMSKKKNGI